MGRSDSLPPVPPHFVAFAWRYRAALTCSLPSTAKRHRRRPGVFLSPVTPRSGSLRRRQGLPGSWGTPLCTCPALRPRWDLRARPSRRFGAAFRYFHHVGSHDHPFRGSITRPAHSLSTLRRHGLPEPRKTRFRLLASFAGRDCLPAGFQTEFQSLVTSHPPCPGFSWRTKIGAGLYGSADGPAGRGRTWGGPCHQVPPRASES